MVLNDLAMLGLEYLDRDVMRRIWNELDEHTCSRSKQHKRGLTG